MVTKATVSHFRCAPSNPGGAARAGPPGVEEDLIASRAAQVGSVLDQDRVATARPTPGCLRTGTTGSPAPGQSRRGCRGLLRRTRSPPGGPRSPSTEKRREKKDPRRRKLLRRRGEVPALYDRGRGPKSIMPPQPPWRQSQHPAPQPAMHHHDGAARCPRSPHDRSNSPRRAQAQAAESPTR